MENDHFVIILPEDDIMSFLHIPLKLQGVNSYFHVRSVTLSEYKHDNILKYHAGMRSQIVIRLLAGQ